MSDDNENLDKLTKVIRGHLERMADPAHPVFRITIERNGYSVDAAGTPLVSQFQVRLEHVSAEIQLPIPKKSPLIMIPGGGTLRAPNGEVLEERS